MTTKTNTFGLNYKREFYLKVEGKQIRDSEGQVKVELKDQTIKTLKKLLDDLKKGEGRKLKLLKQLYGEEYKKFMAN